MKPSFRIIKGILLLMPVIFVCLFCGLSQASEEGPSLEEISKTQAAKFYISRQYQESLDEFEKMEVDYPISGLIKRYIADLQSKLGRRQEAVLKLNEILVFSPDDVVAHQMLGDLYVKQRLFQKAEQEYRWVSQHAPAESKHAKEAARKLEDLKNIQLGGSLDFSKKQMGPQAFMESQPAKDFSQGRYEQALNGFQTLLQQYPEDILIYRFTGIAQLKLGLTEEAFQSFQKGLSLQPENAALHFYLAQTYGVQGKKEEAKKEYQWVVQRDTGNYQLRAQKELFRYLGRGQKPAGASKKWNLAASAGYDYDTNATYKSRDTDFSSAGDQNSGRYNTSFSGNYRLYEKKQVSLTTDGFYAQTIYNDFINLNTYTFGGGVSGLYGFNLFQKPAFLNLRNGLSETLLRNRYYVWSNNLSPSLIFFPHQRVKTSVSYRFVYSHYNSKNNTTVPERNSRNGYTNGVALSNTLYLNQKKNLYTTVGVDYEYASPKGLNYVKNAVGVQTLLHFPVIEKIEGDVSFRFRSSDYPKTLLPLQRRDHLYSLTVNLSRPISEHLLLMLFYTFEDTNARNNLYEYFKNVFGIQLTLRY